MQEIENRDNQIIFEFLAKVLDNEELEQDKSLIRFVLVEDIKILVAFYNAYKQDGKVVQLKVVNELVNKKDKIQSHRTSESIRSRFRYYHSKLDRNRLLNLVDFYFYLVQENEQYNKKCKRYTRNYGLIHKSASILEFDKVKQEFHIQFMDINQRQKKYDFKIYTSQQQIELIKKIPIIAQKILEQPSEVDLRLEDFKDEQGDNQMENIDDDDIENVDDSDNEEIGQKVAKKWQLVTPSSSEYSSSEKKKQIEATNKKLFQKQILKNLKEDQQNIQKPVQLSQNIKKQVQREEQKEKQKNSQEQFQMNQQYIQERNASFSNNNENLSFKNVIKQIKSQENSFQNAQMKAPECFTKQEMNSNYYENIRNNEIVGVFNQPPPFCINSNSNYYQLMQDQRQKYNLNQFKNYSQNYYFNDLQSNGQQEFSNNLTQNLNREGQQSNVAYRENNLKRKISPQFYNKEDIKSGGQDDAQEFDDDEDSQSVLEDLSEDSSQELLQLILKKNILYKMKEHYKEVLIQGDKQSGNQKTINYILANQEPCNKLFQNLDQELQLYKQEQNKQQKWDNLIKYLNEQYNLTHEQIICMLDFCNWDTKLILSYLSDPSLKPQDLIWESNEDEQLINDKDANENYSGSSKSAQQQNKRKHFLEKINQNIQSKQAQK
ncbi:hypothetical protein ABPG74_016927 [Tetrahymena malaccensis]